jgi:hypothetical protein
VFYAPPEFKNNVWSNEGIRAGYCWNYRVAQSVVLTPFAFAKLASYPVVPISSTAKLLILAVALDLLLALLTWFEWHNSTRIGFSGAFIWISLWSVWQVAALLTLTLSMATARKH